MKKLITLVMVTVLSLAACGGGTIVGTWQGMYLDDDEDLTITFYEDGRAVMSDDGERRNGTYTYGSDGNSLRIGRETYYIEIKGKRLVITDLSGEEVARFIKQ